MKPLLGLFLILLPPALLAAESGNKTGMLVLRGRVPASTSIEWENEDRSGTPKVRFNGQKIQPIVKITSKKKSKLITIIHP